MIEWIEEYSIGIRRIDAEHEMLFSLIVDFEKARLLGQHEDVLQDHLSEIAAFAKYQFLEEEHMLKRCGFSELSGHSRKHAEFMDILFNMSL
jgi:hemerythrin